MVTETPDTLKKTANGPAPADDSASTRPERPHGSSPTGRVFYIDNLRVFLIMLVIALHVSIAYGGSGMWSYKEPTSDIATIVSLTMFNGVSQSFFMGLLFMIAGYFTPGSYDRKGIGRFLGDRFLRLGIPLVAYILLIDPIVAYEYATRNGLTHLPFPTFWSQELAGMSFGVGPLWFVQTLLLFSLAYAAFRRLRGSSRGREQGTAGGTPSNFAILVVALGLGVASFAARLAFPIGEQIFGMQLGFYPQYVVLFVVGLVAYRRGWLASLPDRAGKLWLAVALAGIAMMPVLMILGGAMSAGVDSFLGGLHWQALAYAMWEQLVGVALCVVLLIQFRKRFTYRDKLARALSADSYAAYIIQAPVIIAVLLAMRNVHIYPLLKFGIVAPVAITLCFLVSHFVLRRLPFAEKVL